MRTPVVIVVHVDWQNMAQMLLVEHDDMVERLALDAADDLLRVGILPRTLRGYPDLFDAHVLHSLLKNIAVDAVAVTE
jgi:hypothetical protein